MHGVANMGAAEGALFDTGYAHGGGINLINIAKRSKPMIDFLNAPVAELTMRKKSGEVAGPSGGENGVPRSLAEVY